MKNLILILTLFTATTFTFQKGDKCRDPRYLKFVLDNKLDKALEGNISPAHARSIVKCHLSILTSLLAKRATEFKRNKSTTKKSP